MKKVLILSLFITCMLTLVNAQEVPVVVTSESVKTSADTSKVAAVGAKRAKNFIKFNITSALIKNYSLQYERVISRSVSVAVTFRMMAVSGIPYSDNIIKRFDITDAKTQVVIENTNVGNYAITPEIRFYTGKKRYGNGFYLGLFYRYGHYTINNALIPYDTDGGDEVTLDTSGDVSSHTGGFMLGAQWALGKHICLDWWMLGPHFGVSSGDFTSLSSGPLSEVDQQDIADEINDIDIPMFKKTVTVTSDKVRMSFDGPWGGIRAGLSLGVKF
jgi:hypothetical protein